MKLSSKGNCWNYSSEQSLPRTTTARRVHNRRGISSVPLPTCNWTFLTSNRAQYFFCQYFFLFSTRWKRFHWSRFVNMTITNICATDLDRFRSKSMGECPSSTLNPIDSASLYSNQCCEKRTLSDWFEPQFDQNWSIRAKKTRQWLINDWIRYQLNSKNRIISQQWTWKLNAWRIYESNSGWKMAGRKCLRGDLQLLMSFFN